MQQYPSMQQQHHHQQHIQHQVEKSCWFCSIDVRSFRLIRPWHQWTPIMDMTKWRMGLAMMTMTTTTTTQMVKSNSAKHPRQTSFCLSLSFSLVSCWSSFLHARCHWFDCFFFVIARICDAFDVNQKTKQTYLACTDCPYFLISWHITFSFVLVCVLWDNVRHE